MLRFFGGLGMLGLVIALRGPLGEANAARRMSLFRYTPDHSVVKLLAAGHRSTFADLLWLRALPDLSRPFADAQLKERWMSTVLPAITDLEPTFATVYSYGATYLTMVSQDQDAAIELLERGVMRNPRNLKLKVELAMAHFMERDDRKRTVQILEEAVQDPRCDALTMGFYTSLLVDERADVAAVSQWLQFLEYPDDRVREEAGLRLERTLTNIALRVLREFEEQHGRTPTSKQELRDPNLMAEGVMDLVLDSMHLDADGKPSFPVHERLNRRRVKLAAEQWCRQFRSQMGRWPSIDELLNSPVVHLESPPPGMRYQLEEDRLNVVAE